VVHVPIETLAVSNNLLKLSSLQQKRRRNEKKCMGLLLPKLFTSPVCKLLLHCRLILVEGAYWKEHNFFPPSLQCRMIFNSASSPEVGIPSSVHQFPSGESLKRLVTQSWLTPTILRKLSTTV
jgi:hypothetical protein